MTVARGDGSPARAGKNPSAPSRPGPLETLPAVVLAGGMGTRLRSSFDAGPKCLAPIGQHCFLSYLLHWLRGAGIRQLIFCTGYKEKQLRRWLEASVTGMRVRYSPEASPLGTGGALKLAQGLIAADHFVAVNGDSLLAVDLPQMLRFHHEREALITIALTDVIRPARYGCVRLSEEQEIVAFAEKPALAEGPRLINGGVYLMRRQFLDLIPPGKKVSLEQDLFPRLAGAGIYGFRCANYFIDIGIPADLERAQVELPGNFPL
jgi:D-glycero-alpha-D-manno-heptose 1-phosphate guanylyltransferase